MGLFNTPNMLDLIWRKETFPQDGGGFAGLMSGLSAGIGVGKQFKADKKAWKENEANEQAGTRSTENWGEIGRKPPAEKPNPIHYYFGQGSPAVAGGEERGAAFGQPQSASPVYQQPSASSGGAHNDIDKLINAMLAMLGGGGRQGMTLPR